MMTFRDKVLADEGSIKLAAGTLHGPRDDRLLRSKWSLSGMSDSHLNYCRQAWPKGDGELAITIARRHDSPAGDAIQ